jgi:hypothetical protein
MQFDLGSGEFEEVAGVAPEQSWRGFRDAGHYLDHRFQMPLDQGVEAREGRAGWQNAAFMGQVQAKRLSRCREGDADIAQGDRQLALQEQAGRHGGCYEAEIPFRPDRGQRHEIVAAMAGCQFTNELGEIVRLKQLRAGNCLLITGQLQVFPIVRQRAAEQRGEAGDHPRGPVSPSGGIARYVFREAVGRGIVSRLLLRLVITGGDQYKQTGGIQANSVSDIRGSVTAGRVKAPCQYLMIIVINCIILRPLVCKAYEHSHFQWKRSGT